ncbi:glycosyltransferase [Pseudomonas sp. NPDC090592]|uniref:glycosyltransferase n=1 Tax=Pseudomonas sp. NPDC090592 TaxID=3364480 RepID=UPI00383AB1F1
MKTPKVLVLLAAYNGRQWIEEQVQSILAQQAVHVHIVVSVDISTDGTEALVSEWAEKESRLSCLPHGRRFGGAAANFFRLLMETDLEAYNYIAFADQDDVWLPDKLSRAHEVLQHGTYAAYSSDVVAFWPDGHEAVIQKSQPQVEFDYFFEAAGPGCTYVLDTSLASAMKATLLLHQDKVAKVSLHDWFSYAFARANGYAWFIDTQTHMRYRQHASNQVGVNSGFTAYRKRVSKVLGGWWLSQAVLIAELIGKEDDPFVVAWRDGKRMGLLGLAFKYQRCRRRTRDKYAFFMLCLILAVTGVGR